jgi:PleD family two-component response regulator
LVTLTPKSILVVDDDPSVADSLRLLLKIDGHEVEVATDGETALAKHKVGNHDLVIADFLMSGMDGLDTLRRVWLGVTDRDYWAQAAEEGRDVASYDTHDTLFGTLMGIFDNKFRR